MSSSSVPSESSRQPHADRERERDKDREKDPYANAPAVTRHTLSGPSGPIAYTATADWVVLRKKNTPLAKMFHVAYVVEDSPARRPVTFVFNGGPGAASAYLHLGALGPRRVMFAANGTLPPPPARLVDNAESWLAFTDLVFIDPVGTGFSRSLDRPRAGKKGAGASPDEDKENPEFWELERDLDSLGEFISTWLSTNGRWHTPAFIAGESYGGFRVAKLARRLQEKFGVGLNGAVLISPAIEFQSLYGTDYNIAPWVERFPTQVAVAKVHGRSRAVAQAPLDQALAVGEGFANGELLVWLATGVPPSGVEAAAQQMGQLIGLPPAMIAAAGGRIPIERFCRELLRDEGRLVGRYDGSVSTADPYPDRPGYEGPDPTLAAIERLYAAGINQHLRDALKLDTSLHYRLLSYEVNGAWKFGKEGFTPMVGAMDDLRYGMALNERTHVFITHGYYDLVTPYFSSERLAALMKLSEVQRARLTLRHFPGGHMFYSWDDSRREFTAAVQRFYGAALETV